MSKKATKKPQVKDPTTLQNITIASLRAMGKTCREIGDKVHLSHDAIAKRLKKEDIKARIDKMLSYYASYSDDVARGFMSLVMDNDKEVRHKAIVEYNKIMGITAAHPSLVIQHIYQDNRVQIVSPHVQELLNKHLGQTIEGEIIEDKGTNKDDNL